MQVDQHVDLAVRGYLLIQEIPKDGWFGKPDWRLIRLEKPDVILMDIRMPEMDGLEATRRIVGGGSETRVLILTTFDLDEYVFGALRAGASGFLLKDTQPEELLAAVHVVADGEALLAPRITRRLIEQFVQEPAAVVVERNPGLDTLTDREHEVLAAVARGLSNAEIAEHFVLSERTVHAHLRSIFDKLGVNSRTAAAHASASLFAGR